MKEQTHSDTRSRRAVRLLGIFLLGLAISSLVFWGVMRLLDKPIHGFAPSETQDWLNLALVALISTGASVRIWSLGSAQSASALALTEGKLLSLRSKDPLTGVFNRDGFRNALEQMLEQADNHELTVGLLIIDVDRFRIFVDSLGKPAGDLLLRSVADRIRAVVRSNDLVARVGENQFAVLAETANGEQGLVVMARNILRAFEVAYPIGGRETIVSLSIGIVAANQQSNTVDELIRYGELALHGARRSGGGRYQVYKSTMGVTAAERLELEASLSRAGQREEFKLFYQPIIDGNSGEVTAVEALLRWFNPLRGSVSPAEFIPIIEQTGQIVDVGAWVLRTACAQCLEWINDGAQLLILSVNVSPRQFLENEFVDTVAQVLKDTKFPASQLQLEVTEGLLLDASPETLKKIEALATLGIKLALDDFGMGNSSLSYMTKFPLSTLKIDRRFVRDIPKNERDTAIVRAIIDLGHGLGMHVTAEGVEEEEQGEALRQLNCDTLQGFLFARPQAPEDIPAALRKTIAPSAQLRPTDAAQSKKPEQTSQWIPVNRRIRVLRNHEVLVDTTNALRLIRYDPDGIDTALCIPLCDVKAKLGQTARNTAAKAEVLYDLLGHAGQILQPAIARVATPAAITAPKGNSEFIAFEPSAVTVEESTA